MVSNHFPLHLLFLCFISSSVSSISSSPSFPPSSPSRSLVSPSSCSLSPLSVPARGWNSYPGFSVTFNETLLIQQATILANLNLKNGEEGEGEGKGKAEGGGGGGGGGGQYKYVVVDEGWAAINGSTSNWNLDEYGRPVFNPLLYPSTAKSSSSSTTLSLVTTLREMGLELGLWLIRGIPSLAVSLSLPIFGTNYTARDIADVNFRCPWHQDVYGINMSHPAGQAYYDSLIDLYYNQWGVTYFKADCMFGTRDLINPGELIGLSKAVESATLSSLSSSSSSSSSSELPPCPRLSLSPGVSATSSMVSLYSRFVHSYRVTDDLWDCWSSTEPCAVDDGINIIGSTVPAMVQFQKNVGGKGLLDQPSFPDADALPLGLLRLGGRRVSSLSRSESEFLMMLYSIYGAVFIIGGDLEYLNTGNSPKTISNVTNTNTNPAISYVDDDDVDDLDDVDWLRLLYSNPRLSSVHLDSVRPSSFLYEASSLVCWLSESRSDPLTRYIGIFPFNKTTSDNIQIVTHQLNYAELNLTNSKKSNNYNNSMSVLDIDDLDNSDNIFASFDSVLLLDVLTGNQLGVWNNGSQGGEWTVATQVNRGVLIKLSGLGRS